MGADIVPVTSVQQLWGCPGPFPGTAADQCLLSPPAGPCWGFFRRPLSSCSLPLPPLAPLSPRLPVPRGDNLAGKLRRELVVGERGGAVGWRPATPRGHRAQRPGFVLAPECPMAPCGLLAGGGARASWMPVPKGLRPSVATGWGTESQGGPRGHFPFLDLAFRSGWCTVSVRAVSVGSGPVLLGPGASCLGSASLPGQHW